MEQNLQIKQYVSQPGASCAEFSLAGDTPAQAGIQPRHEQLTRLSVPARLQHRRPNAARPWRSTDLRDKALRGEGHSWKGSRPTWPVAKGTRTPPSSSAFRDQHIPLPREHKDQIQNFLFKQKFRKSAATSPPPKVAFWKATLDGIQGPNSRRALPTSTATPPSAKRDEGQKITHDLQICTVETAPGQKAGWARTVVPLPCSKLHTFLNVA